MAAPDRDDYKNICSIRELFHGRFTDSEIATVYDLKEKDRAATVDFLLNESAEEITRVIKEEEEAWDTVAARVRRIKTSDVVQLARDGRIRTDARQFGCQPCDSVWWKKIPHRKPVSKCNKCRMRYEAIPRVVEWGWAQYNCQCGRSFQGYGAMGKYSVCYNCSAPVTPVRIIPPDEQKYRGPGRNKHSCLAPNCCGNPNGGYLMDPRYVGLPVECVHPATRRFHNLPLVVFASLQHISTGSTVDTFLPQRNMELQYEPVLGPISDDEDVTGYGGVD